MEGEQTYGVMEEIRRNAEHYYGKEKVLLVGNSTSAHDLETSFATDNVIISVLTAFFVMVILFFTFQSGGLPVLLVLTIQGSIWINFSVPALAGEGIYFIAYLIVSATQMGATIDYAIVISSRYMQLKREMPLTDAIVETLNQAFPTIFTSGFIMTCAGFLIGNISSDATVAAMGIALGRGTLISIILVLFALPQILLFGNFVIEKTVLTMNLIRTQKNVSIAFIISSTAFCYAAADKEERAVNRNEFMTVQKEGISDTQSTEQTNEAKVIINTIEDLYEFVENCRYDKESDLGFFRYLGEQAAVSRLKIEGIIDPSGSQENIGGIVGVNYGKLVDCSFEGKVSGQNAVGGIAGLNRTSGRIISCSSDAVVLATNDTGGIAGKNEGTILDCTSSSRINVEKLETTQDIGGVDLGSLNLAQNMVTRNNMGGIAGSSSGTILRSANRGTVGYEHTGYNAGGIAGNQNGVIGQCSNQGKVYGRKDVGGIVGQAEPYIESEYLDHRIEETKNEINRLNQTLNSISSTLSSTSKEAREYAVSLSGQYDRSMKNVSASLAGLSDSIAGDYPEAQKYAANINGAMEQINAVQLSGKDQVKLIQTNARSVIENLAGLSEALAKDNPETQGILKTFELLREILQ